MLRLSAVIVIALAACGGRQAPPIDANTVALTQGAGIDAAFDTEVREAIATQLAEAGFAVTTDVNAAATSLVLDLRAEKARPGLTEGASLWRVEAVVHAKAPSASEDLRVGFVREANRGIEVALWAKRWLIEELGKQSVAWLALQPEMVAEVERLTKKRTREELVFTRPRAEAYAGHRRAWDDYCRAEVERMAELDKVSGLTCVGDPCSQWTPLGLAPDGQSALVQENRRRPTYGLKVARDLSWLEEPERVLRVPLVGGGEPQIVFEAMNLYAFGDVSFDGKVMTVSTFTADERLAFARVDTTSGAFVGQPRVLAEHERSGFAYPLSGGMLVGLAPMELVLSAGRTPLPEVSTVWRARDGFTARGEGLLVRYDGHGRERGKMLMEQRTSVVIDGGATLYVVERVGSGCNLLHVSGDPMAIVAAPALETCIASGAALADGRIVGIADASRSDDMASGDLEVVLVTPATGRVQALTRDAYEQDSLHAAGQRVVFGRVLPDFPAEHDVRLYRRQVCWLDVPAAP